jgi:ABC-type sugar transport system substrate-binding protein
MVVDELRAGKVRTVRLDAAPDWMKLLNDGVVRATAGQRPHDMGKRSPELLHWIPTRGLELADLPKERVADAGVDVANRQSLSEEKHRLKPLGVPADF